MKRVLLNIRDYFQSGKDAYRKLYKSLLYLISVYVIYYFLMVSLIPVLKYRYVFPEKKTYQSRGIKHDLAWYYSAPDSLYDHSMSLAAREAFLLARTEMTGDDSICMTVDLLDSTVSLVVKGVVIFSTMITDYSYSRLLKRTDPILTAHYLSWPFRVAGYSSSIPKIPVIVRKAPKDTLEAASMPEPEMLEENREYVGFKLLLDRQLILNINQDSISDSISNRSKNRYFRQERKMYRKSVRKALFFAHPREFLPEIKLKLNRSDAMILFRAIPEQAEVAGRLDR